jgi:hypothetical protein
MLQDEEDDPDLCEVGYLQCFLISFSELVSISLGLNGTTKSQI